MNEHLIQVQRYPYFSSEYVYVAICSCGRYRSGKNTCARDAERAGHDHVKSKTS